MKSPSNVGIMKHVSGLKVVTNPTSIVRKSATHFVWESVIMQRQVDVILVRICLRVQNASRNVRKQSKFH